MLLHPVDVAHDTLAPGACVDIPIVGLAGAAPGSFRVRLELYNGAGSLASRQSSALVVQ